MSEKKTTKRCNKKDGKQNNVESQQPLVINFVPNFVPDYNFGYLNMFSQGQGMSQPISQPPFMQNSLPPQFPGAFAFQASAPPWAAKLLEDMEQIKQKLQGIDKTEKTVNLINSKVSVLETKMADLDTS